MKRLFIYIFVLLLAFVIVGCKTPNKQLSFKDVTDIKLYKETNFEYNSIYERYNITNNKKINDFLLELNKIEYKEQKETNDILEYYDYVIILDNLYIILVIDNYFYLSNDGINYTLCHIISNNFDFLDNIEFKLKHIETNGLYNEDDLKTIILENVNNNIIVDVTQNKNIKKMLIDTKYHINDLETEDLKLQYIIHLSNEKGICVYEQGVIGFFNTESIYDKAYKVLNNEFDILDNIIDDEIITLNFENVSKVVIYKSQNGEKEISDYNSIIENFNKLEMVRIIDNSYLFNYTYGVQINDDVFMTISEQNIIIFLDKNGIVCKDEDGNIMIYILNNCTMEFLDEINFK